VSAGSVVSPQAPVARRRRGFRTLGLISGPLGYVALFFLIPVGLAGAYSVGALTLLPQDAYLSFRPWTDFFSSHVYLGLFWKSIRMALIVSVSSVLLAYPVAYFLALVAGRRKYTLLLITIAPFMTSYLLRVLAWRVILGEKGLANSFLHTVGLVPPDQAIKWLFYSQFAVYFVLAYAWIPFVALPIFVTLESLDTSLLEASTDLGASHWRTFWYVTLPLSLPGVMAASIFVFNPTIGEYITPLLVGGPSGYMFGNAIQSSFSQSFDWQFGSAMSVFLIGAVGLLIAIFGRYLNVRTIAR
jgi:spermidine/putrescine transport system permease protein